MVEAAREPELFIFTVINRDYMGLGLGWAQQVRNVTGKTPHFICADVDSLQFLESKGLPCTLRLPEGDFSESEISHYQRSSFPNDKAAYTVSLKLAVAESVLESGRPILYCDVDAIWLKDPLQDLLTNNVDFAFQPGSFPDDAKSLWGFTVCTGFFLMRPSAETIRLAKLVQHNFDGSDQRTLNDILMKEFDITWSDRPERWETCQIKNGWTTPIIGNCQKTNLTAMALPHSFYQRHGTEKKTCQHAIICHPNSPKDQEGKVVVLENLGIGIRDIIEKAMLSSSNVVDVGAQTSNGSVRVSDMFNWIKRLLRFRWF